MYVSSSFIHLIFYFYINSFYKEASYISDRQVPENLNAEQLLTAEGWEPLTAAEADTIKADASAARKNADVLPMAARNVKNMLLVVLDRKENGFYWIGKDEKSCSPGKMYRYIPKT